MIHLPDYKTLMRGTALSVFVIIIVFYISLRQTRVTNDAASRVVHTQEVLFHTEKLLFSATNLETGARAFVLTGQQQFMDTYLTSADSAKSALSLLKKMTADNPVQQTLLDTLSAVIYSRKLFSDSLITLKKNITLEQSPEIIKYGNGKAYTESIKKLAGKMQLEENRLLAIRQQVNANHIMVQHRILVYSITALLAILVFIFWQEKRQTVKKEKSRTDIIFRNLLESAPDPTIITDAQDKILIVNHAAELIFAQDRQDLTGLSLQSVICDYTASANDNALSEFTAVTRQGIRFPVEVSVSAIEIEGGKLRYVAARDITQRNLATERLRQSEEFFRLLVKSVHDYAIFMVDLKGIIVSWNSGAENIKGYREDEITGQSFEVFYTLEDRAAGEPFHNLAMAAQYGHYEKEGRRVKKDGTLFWADVVFTALKDSAGNMYGYCKITRDITERKKTQEQLGFLYRQIDQSNDAIYNVDTDLNIKSWNRGAENLYGYTKKEVLGKNPNTLLQTALPENELMSVLDVITADDYWAGELKRVTKSGKQIIVRASTTSVRNEQGDITGYVSSNYDITEQKKLIDQVRHLASIVDQTSEAIFSRGADNRIISWNNGAEKLFGISRADAVGRKAAELGFLKLTGKEIEDITHHLINSGQWKTEMYFCKKDGSTFFGSVTANTIKNESGQITSYNFIVKDISERKQLEEALIKSKEELELRVEERTREIYERETRFRSLIENISDAIVVNDEASNILYQSPSVIKILGYQPEERMGKKVVDYIHPDNINEYNSLYSELKEIKGIPLPFQYRFLHKNGNYIWIEGVVSNLTDNPAVGGYVANYRDITERKGAEDNIRKLNAELEERVLNRTEQLYKINQELEAFSYSVSHDLRAPLRFISGFTSKLEENYGSQLDAEAMRITGIIKKSTIKMGALIDDLLSFSRMGRQELVKTAMDTDILVKEITDGYKKEMQHTVEWKIEKLPVSFGDKSTMRQVWINLISNAIKYSAKAAAPLIEIGYCQKDDSIVFFVKDNGIGFDEKYKGKLFKVFQRLHSADEFEGTGIGLAIVEKIISRHGGKVWVEAATGKGACFSFSLPVAAPKT